MYRNIYRNNTLVKNPRWRTLRHPQNPPHHETLAAPSGKPYLPLRVNLLALGFESVLCGAGIPTGNVCGRNSRNLAMEAVIAETSNTEARGQGRGGRRKDKRPPRKSQVHTVHHQYLSIRLFGAAVNLRISVLTPTLRILTANSAHLRFRELFLKGL
jgi:hypothetical protein